MTDYNEFYEKKTITDYNHFKYDGEIIHIRKYKNNIIDI